MKNLKAHHHLAIATLLCLGIASFWAIGNVVQADSSDAEIAVYVGPPDACKNIPGYQTEVPTGMTADGDRNCSSPTPPVVDVCDNIAGDQNVVPDGYYRDGNGNCQLQTTPPRDVCSNLVGLQETVPPGRVSTESNMCVFPPTDQCDNVDGPQYIAPDGMVRTDNGICFTPNIASPSAPTTPGENPWIRPLEPRAPTPGTAGAVDLKNVPNIIDPILAPIVAAIPEEVKELLRSLPPAVARTVPYALFGIIGLSALVMAWQALREVAAARRLALLLRRERNITEEKDNFIALASHYLRTPLTIMETATSTVVSLHALTSEAVSPLTASLANLKTRVGNVLGDISNNTALQGIQAPEFEKTPHGYLRAVAFWLPLSATILLTLLSNFFLGVVGEVELGTYNMLTQVVVFVAISLLFYSALRTYHLRHIERTYEASLLEHETAIDDARNSFIEHTTAILNEELARIETDGLVLSGTPIEAQFRDGYERFEHLLKKLELLGEIKTGAVGSTEVFDIHANIDSLISLYSEQLRARKLRVVNEVKSTKITQSRGLFDFVLGSLIDNAVKFSDEGSTILISSSPREGTLSVTVVDHGVTIADNVMPQLFKPFSRGTSALTFNYEGLGFSLFLDKIIMDYVGGSITASSSKADRTTSFTVTTKLS